MLAKSTKNSIILATSIVIVALVLGFTFIFGGVAGGNVLAATSYTINYDANGGTLTGSSTQTVNQGDTITLPNVEKVGYSARWIDQTTPAGTAITTAAQLAGISSSGTYYLANDIDLSSYSNWTPISSFSGTLDGRGYSIKNLKITSGGNSGLFANVGGATIKNIKMVSVNIRVSSSGGLVGAFVAGCSSCNINNCSMDGTVEIVSTTSNWPSIGGFIGNVGSTVNITNCTNNASIVCSARYSSNDWQFVGGFVGYNSGTLHFNNSCNNGSVKTTVSSSNTKIGGFVGTAGNDQYAYFTNCYNNAVLSAASSANIAAFYGNVGTIVANNCFVAGSFSGSKSSSCLFHCGATVSSMVKCYYLSGTTINGSTISGTVQNATAIADVATLASTFYNNMSSTDKSNWNYTAGSYPTLRDWNHIGNPGEQKIINSNYTLKAVYTVNTYTVVFNGNKATGGSMNNSSLVYNSSNLPANAYTRNGYNFAGWSLNNTATTIMLANNAIFGNLAVGANNNGATVTLYAIWQSTINLDQQGGTGGTSSITAIENANMPTATKPTFTNFTFGGYYTEIGGKGTQYYNTSMASTHVNDLTNGKTLYAYWTSTINLDQQSGVNGSTSVTGTYNLAMPAITAPTRNGYTFGGYFTGQGGSGTQYYTMEVLSAHVYDLPSGTTLYAKWTCTVILDQQGGADGTASVNPVYNATMPKATAPTRTGWTFGGYYTQVGGGGKQYYTKDMVSANKWTEVTNVTLYAKWTATIALNMEGGAGGTASITVTYNAPMPTATAPTRTGYTFGGYYTESNGNGTRFYNRDMVSMQNWNLAVNTALYAKWDANVYTITFQYNGATSDNDIASKPVTYGTFYSDLPAPKKAGSAFVGWFLESNFVTPITNTSTMSIAKNHTLYAKWVAWLNIHVSGVDTTVTAKTNLDQDVEEAKVIITPKSGQYVESISFDNVLFYAIDCYTKVIADLDFGVSVTYFATMTHNRIVLDMNIISEYFDTTGAIDLYIVLTNQPYTSLRTGGGSAVSGVAVSATKGGSVTIIGDAYEDLGDTDTVTVVANTVLNGYKFDGWYLADNMANCLSTNASERFTKKMVYEAQLVAKFSPINPNDSYNGDKNN